MKRESQSWRGLYTRQGGGRSSLDTLIIALVYIFLEYEPQLGKAEKFNSQGMKEKKVFRIPFITKKQLQSWQALHIISLKTQYKVQRGASILFFLMVPFVQEYLSTQVRISKWYKQCCLPPLSFKISLKANINISQTSDLNKQQLH